jgi:ABC-type phosphate transport system ATPase subunit
MFQLVERFYDPQGGTIRIDGVPLTSADPAEVRARIALVPQETVLFSANARDNLRYGKWDATDEDIWQAARAANAESFLRALPQGLDTYLGEGGTQLSGGSSSASPSPARCCAMRRSCCSMKPPARWMPKASSWCSRRSRADEGPHHAGDRPPPRHGARGGPDRRAG